MDGCRPGAFVAMYSGWGSRVANAERFLNKDSKGTMHAPGFSEDVAKFLVKERDIVGAGVDTLSLDAASATKFVAHLALLGAGKYGVELLANLNAVPPSGATIIVGGPKHEGASGGPCRVSALCVALTSGMRSCRPGLHYSWALKVCATSAAARSTRGSASMPQLATSSFERLHRLTCCSSPAPILAGT